MIQVDVEAMKAIAQDSYEPMVIAQHGPDGAIALKQMLEVLHLIFRRVDPGTISGTLTIIRAVASDEILLDKAAARQVANYDELLPLIKFDSTIQLLPSGELNVWINLLPDHEALAQLAIVYTYKQSTECFRCKSERREVRKLVSGFPSMFAIPTFTSLRDALSTYKVKMARYSSCDILRRVWHDKTRYFLCEKPEWIMRKSLAQFLRCTLTGDVNVREEQNVDDSHPIDIQVTWMLSRQMALIEIKWLGKSRKDDGRLGVEFSSNRARSGALQLAEYLEWNLQRSPTHETRGFLVVMDARRRALKAATTSLSQVNGYYYDNSEIAYNPSFHLIRGDFEIPFRFFLTPECVGN